MARDALRGFLQLGFFIAAAGLCAVIAAPRDSGEFVISVCSTIIGLLLIVGVVVLWRLMK
jgi:hypothetical protein